MVTAGSRIMSQLIAWRLDSLGQTPWRVYFALVFGSRACDTRQSGDVVAYGLVTLNPQRGTEALPMAPLVEVKDLHVEFTTRDGTVKAVNGITFSLEPGKVLTILGESGSGKS